MKLALALLLALLPRVDPALQAEWRNAITEWSPYVPLVREVRWYDGADCEDTYGGGGWNERQRVILICTPILHDLRLIMLHEYGHALLGYGHVLRSERLSIMNDGWMEPYGTEVTAEDKAAVKRLREKR